MKKKSIFGGIASAYFFLAAVMYGTIAVKSILYNMPGVKITQKGFQFSSVDWSAFFPTGQWMLLLPVLFAVIAGALTLVTALKGVRWCGIAAAVGAAGAVLSWLLIPPQAYMRATYVTYRFFFGLNLESLVENLPFLFPLYRLVFLAGGVLLTAMGIQRLRTRRKTAERTFGV